MFGLMMESNHLAICERKDKDIALLREINRGNDNALTRQENELATLRKETAKVRTFRVACRSASTETIKAVRYEGGEMGGYFAPYRFYNRDEQIVAEFPYSEVLSIIEKK